MTAHANAAAMTAHLVTAVAGDTSLKGWYIGYAVGVGIVLVVVALVVPILLLARAIGRQAEPINGALTEAVHNTAPLKELATTIDHAEVITAGLGRGRTRLGG